MKKFIRTTCVIVALVILLTVPVSAAGTTIRSNPYIAIYSSYFARTSSMYQFQVWFEVTGTNTMDKIGVSEIIIQRRDSEEDDWSTLKTFLPEDYPNMIITNALGHDSYVTYTAPPGYYYRAIVTFYAKKGNGTTEIFDYPEFYF